MRVYLKTVVSGRDVLVAACDEELLGKTLEGGRVPFKVSESFYGGALAEVEELVESMRRATICNLVGRVSVEAAIEAGLVHERGVIYLGEVPHAQIVKL